jgi:hypothetical protein
VGETITSVLKTSLSPGGADSIIYSTIGGGIGALQVSVRGRGRERQTGIGRERGEERGRERREERG